MSVGGGVRVISARWCREDGVCWVGMPSRGGRWWGVRGRRGIGGGGGKAHFGVLCVYCISLKTLICNVKHSLE